MNYGPLKLASQTLWLTATEAAYSVLFGLYLPRRGFVWTSGISADMQLEEEEWRVEAMDVHHFTATGVRYQGRLMELFSVQPAGVGPLDLPSNRLQYGNARVCLDHPVEVNRGVGFRYATPAFIDTDGIQMSVLFRQVRR
jgi:hypothetical protein